MRTYLATLNVSPTLREAHSRAIKKGGRLAREVDALTQEHLRYLKELKSEGKIIAAGPLVDFSRALMLLRADSIEEATALAENDPAVKSELFTDLKIEPWYHMV